jgi:hypothetical protein
VPKHVLWSLESKSKDTAIGPCVCFLPSFVVFLLQLPENGYLVYDVSYLLVVLSNCFGGAEHWYTP